MTDVVFPPQAFGLVFHRSPYPLFKQPRPWLIIVHVLILDKYKNRLAGSVRNGEDLFGMPVFTFALLIFVELSSVIILAPNSSHTMRSIPEPVRE